MSPELSATLRELRWQRGFDAQVYRDAKARLLNTYCARFGLTGVVVGVSGGIDSAVTLGLVAHAARLPSSPIRRVVGALAPMFGSAGATNQDVATARGREVIRAFGAEEMLVDLSQAVVAMQAAGEAAARHSGSNWATGQLVSYLRTPAFYHLATLLTDQGERAIVIGTTNRDEGSYIGFFGKASDGMVDVQLISDLHKSEVYALANILGVPEAAIRATPTGDTFDGRTDEQMIGVGYDGIELHALLATADATMVAGLKKAWSAEAADTYSAWEAAIEQRHRDNLHKYLGASPAVHLDVYERAVPGGSPAPPQNPPRPPPTDTSSSQLTWQSDATTCRRVAIADCGDSAFLIEGLLAPAECEALRDSIANAPSRPVGIDGMAHDFDPARDRIGSYRTSVYDTPLAEALWRRLAPQLQRVRLLQQTTPTDSAGHLVYRAVGINPFFRFMRYPPGGMVVPHYDSTFDFGDGRRTLMSVVVYLSHEANGTRLLLDTQRHLPVHELDFRDAEGTPPEHTVLVTTRPRAGDALVLDHRMPHDAEPWRGPGVRLVMRTDVIFQQCGVPAGDETPPTRPLWSALGLTPTASAAAIDEAARRSSANPDAVAAWRVLRDPYYRDTYNRLGSREAVVDAGFLDDGRLPTEPRDVRNDVHWLSTPVHKARIAKCDPGKPLVALLSTGAFYPVHRGHIAMMDIARAELEARGYAVVGGYLSPSHDDYVRVKCGADVPGAEHRLRLCERAVEDSDWLMVDGWEALHTGRALNFTDVIMHLEAYLSAHLRCHRPVQVAYVFGADNARFVASFLTRGLAVCVPRPGYDDRIARAMAQPFAKSERIIVARESAPDAASSVVRNGDQSQLTDHVRRVWRSWQREPTAAQRGIIHLRDEGDWAVAPWLTRASNAGDAMRVFRAGLLRELSRAFREAKTPDAPTEIQITVLELSRQRVQAGAATQGKRVLSLDPCIQGDVNIGVSRCFDLALQRSRRGIVARPGWPSIDAQLASLPRDSYVLLDDDKATGETIAAVRALVSRYCDIERVVTLCDISSDAHAIADLVDSRDFLPGARDAGLVVALPSGALARVPYALPYVRPADRCSVPPSAELGLSRAIWRLAAELFASLDATLCVADASPAFGALCSYIGLARDMPLRDVCEWHLERLAR